MDALYSEQQDEDVDVFQEDDEKTKCRLGEVREEIIYSPLFDEERAAKVFDCELRRVASEEGQSVSNFIEEVAKLTGCSAWTLYNYRSGKWPLRTALVPVLCRRFRSFALMEAVARNQEPSD